MSAGTAPILRPSHRAGAAHVTTTVITTLPALERELADGLMTAWKALVHDDPLASCFQAPGWCMPWYRSYHDEFDPYVIRVSAGERLVGLIPLSVRRRGGELAFASGTMADYRDIVAHPDYRQVVVDELIRTFLAGRFPNPLQIGWLDPSSDTPVLVANAAARRRTRFISWQQPCYRWFPAPAENLNKKFARLRTHLNHLKKLGEVTFEVITTPADWTGFKDSFFQQHSVRQLQADRQVTFDDARKRRFYDRVFDSGMFQTHATALRLDGQLVSGHIGWVWKDVLMLGAPSISIEHEQRSPALILLSWIMQNAAGLGLEGLDLTVGDTEFKRRLGNECVQATMLEVYASRRAYYARTLRNGSVRAAKRFVARVGGETAWRTRVLPAIERLIARARGLAARRSKVVAVPPPTAGLPSVLTPDSLGSLAAAPAPEGGWLVARNRVEDLLLLAGGDTASERAVRDCARDFARLRAAGNVLHTLTAQGRLLAWAFARRNEDTATVSHLQVVPEGRASGAAFALVRRIADEQFASGAARVEIAGA